MLAAEYDPDKFPLRFPVLASPKIDGIRCVIRHGQPLTRSLKPIPNRHIRAALSGFPALDGELVVGDPTDPKAWNKTSSAVMSHDGEPEFTYFVFDTVVEDIAFSERLQIAKSRAGMYGPMVRFLHHAVVNDLSELTALEEDYVNAGYEGIMLRDPAGPYKWGRSTAKEGYLLKLKRFDDSEVIVIDIKERMSHVGEFKTNALGLTERDHKKENFVGAGDLGALRCCWLDHSRPQDLFDVGSGFTAEQRELWWASPPIGRCVRIKHQGLTPDGKPRFPIFQGFRDERDLG